MTNWKSRFNDKFRDYFSLWIELLEVKELGWAIDVLALILDVYLLCFLGMGFIKATLLSALFHLVLSSIVSFMGTIKDREYHRKKKIQFKFLITLDRLALNKSRKAINASKTGI